MANRRMFSLKVVDTDAFLDMPQTAQNLYFHLAMRADDDGFVDKPKQIMKTVGSGEDDMKVLVAKRFIIPFEDGVCVIKHWRIHNLIRSDRYTPTNYLEHKDRLEVKENGSYTERKRVIPDGNHLEPQYRIGKDRLLGAPRIVTVDDSEKEDKPKKTEKYPHHKEVFILWGDYPKRWLNNNTQKQAAEDLFAEVEGDLVELKGALDFYEKHKHLDYAPEISTPHDLATKWEKLDKFFDRVNS